VRPRAHLYFAMNKPSGVVTTRSDELQRRTVYKCLPPSAGWLFPVGRLDKETSGLLLCANDTRLGERFTNLLEDVPKTYAAKLDRKLAERDRERLQSGVRMNDGTRYTR
jgi:23S rRNA pseudouridine2605 synthase